MPGSGEDDSDPLRFKFKQFFQNLRRSRLFKYAFLCVTTSEMVEWLVVIITAHFLESSGINKYAVVIGAMAPSEYFFDYLFDFLWISIVSRFYKENHGGLKTVANLTTDLFYFGVIDWLIWPVILTAEISLSFYLNSIGLPQMWAIAISCGILIPPYVVIFLIFGTPLILKREKNFNFKLTKI